MNFLFTICNVRFESFQIKVVDLGELHLEECTAHGAAMADGPNGVGAALSRLAIGSLVLAQLLPQCITLVVTDTLVFVVTRAVDEERVVAAFEGELTEGGLQKLAKLRRGHLPAIDGDALERQCGS